MGLLLALVYAEDAGDARLLWRSVHAHCRRPLTSRALPTEHAHNNAHECSAEGATEAGSGQGGAAMALQRSRASAIWRHLPPRDIWLPSVPRSRPHVCPPAHRPPWVLPEVLALRSRASQATIERPRVRARLVGQGERARPPWEGGRHDPMPPSSPGETSAGQSTLSGAAVPVGGEAGSGPRPKKRHQKRLQRPSHDARLANKRAGQGEPEPREGLCT